MSCAVLARGVPAANHRDGYAYALNEIGLCHSLLGDHQQALTCLQEALDINQELGDRRGQAECWEYLGRAHHQLGNSPRPSAATSTRSTSTAD